MAATDPAGTDPAAPDPAAADPGATDRRARSARHPAESELIVGLTDLAVGVVALGLLRSTLTARIPREPGGGPARRARRLRRGFGAFFAATAVAALAGAALHGLFPDRDDARRRPLWRLSLGAIGSSASAGIDIAAALAMPGRVATTARVVAGVALVGWFGVLVVSVPPYRAVVAFTVPSIAVLAAALASRLGVARERAAAVLGMGGLGLTAAAAVVQLRGIGPGRRFGPNALYHTIQAVALVVLGRSALAFLRVADAGSDRRIRPPATASTPAAGPARARHRGVGRAAAPH